MGVDPEEQRQRQKTVAEARKKYAERQRGGLVPAPSKRTRRPHSGTSSSASKSPVPPSSSAPSDGKSENHGEDTHAAEPPEKTPSYERVYVDVDNVDTASTSSSPPPTSPRLSGPSTKDPSKRVKSGAPSSKAKTTAKAKAKATAKTAATTKQKARPLSGSRDSDNALYMEVGPSSKTRSKSPKTTGGKRTPQLKRKPGKSPSRGETKDLLKSKAPSSSLSTSKSASLQSSRGSSCRSSTADGPRKGKGKGKGKEKDGSKTSLNAASSPSTARKAGKKKPHSKSSHQDATAPVSSSSVESSVDEPLYNHLNRGPAPQGDGAAKLLDKPTGASYSHVQPRTEGDGWAHRVASSFADIDDDEDPSRDYLIPSALVTPRGSQSGPSDTTGPAHAVNGHTGDSSTATPSTTKASSEQGSDARDGEAFDNVYYSTINEEEVKRKQHLFATDWLQTNFYEIPGHWMDLSQLYSAFRSDCRLMGIFPLAIKRLADFVGVLFPSVQQMTSESGERKLLLVNISPIPNSKSVSVNNLRFGTTPDPKLHPMSSQDDVEGEGKGDEKGSTGGDKGLHSQAPAVPPRKSLGHSSPSTASTKKAAKQKQQHSKKPGKQSKSSPKQQKPEHVYEKMKPLKPSKQRNVSKPGNTSSGSKGNADGSKEARHASTRNGDGGGKKDPRRSSLEERLQQTASPDSLRDSMLPLPLSPTSAKELRKSRQGSLSSLSGTGDGGIRREYPRSSSNKSLPLSSASTSALLSKEDGGTPSSRSRANSAASTPRSTGKRATPGRSTAKSGGNYSKPAFLVNQPGKGSSSHSPATATSQQEQRQAGVPKINKSKLYADVKPRIDSGIKHKHRKMRFNINEIDSDGDSDGGADTDATGRSTDDELGSNGDYDALSELRRHSWMRRGSSTSVYSASKHDRMDYGRMDFSEDSPSESPRHSMHEGGVVSSLQHLSTGSVGLSLVPGQRGSRPGSSHSSRSERKRHGSSRRIQSSLKGVSIRRKKADNDREVPAPLKMFPMKSNGLVDAREFSWTEDNITKEEFDQYLAPMKCRREDLEIGGRVLGRGHYGCVVQGLLNIEKGGVEGCVRVAVKQMLANDTPEADWEIRREASIMLTLGDPPHPHILQILGICDDDNQFYVIMELCALGDLRKLLISSRDGSVFQTADLLEFCNQIANGMSYLEMNKIVHRDLAARNVLVTSDLQMKISDYGLARGMEGDVYTTTTLRELPYKWMAPESLEQQIFTPKSDVWAYGVTMFEVFSEGATPYGSVPNRNVLVHIRDGHRLYKPFLATDEIYELMKKCWIYDHKERISFREICLAVTEMLGKFKAPSTPKRGVFHKLKAKLQRRRYIGKLSSLTQGHLLTCLREGLVDSEQVNEISMMVKGGQIDVSLVPEVRNVEITPDSPVPEDVAYLLAQMTSSEV